MRASLAGEKSAITRFLDVDWNNAISVASVDWFRAKLIFQGAGGLGVF
jgi:hypothetical protein